MRLGIISGSGGYPWPGITDRQPRTCHTRYGTVDVTAGLLAGIEVVHLARHGAAHARLSHQVTHKANLAALRDQAVDAVVSLTVCGAVDPTLAAGTVIVFDDLYFPTNRLPDGSLCTWHEDVASPDRGHWIFDTPMSGELRQALVDAARGLDLAVRDGGCYGHVDGPRFNSRTEIAALARAGVCAVSQTAGPEVVLAGEAQLPIALLGFITDHANGVLPEPLPLTELSRLMAASGEVFAQVVTAAAPTLGTPTPAGVVYRLEEPRR
jgi:5'-methylthioadenosine phosphorylase